MPQAPGLSRVEDRSPGTISRTESPAHFDRLLGVEDSRKRAGIELD
jgi:hypothetical protein